MTNYLILSFLKHTIYYLFSSEKYSKTLKIIKNACNNVLVQKMLFIIYMYI